MVESSGNYDCFDSLRAERGTSLISLGKCWDLTREGIARAADVRVDKLSHEFWFERRLTFVQLEGILIRVVMVHGLG